MHVFNATIRLQGAIGNEVPKYGLTVPEVHILRQLHGTDGVVNLKHVGTALDLDSDEERERLSFLYDEGLANLGDDIKTSVDKMFGGSFTDLPTKLKGFEGPFSKEEAFLEEFQEPVHPAQEDVGITPMEKARQRREESQRRRKERAAAQAKEDKSDGRTSKGKAGLEAAL